MALTDPNLGLSYGWAQGENNWNGGMDANLKRLGAVVGLSVKDRDLTTPPASPVDGDRYIVATGGTDAWAGKDEQVAVWISGAWEFYAPQIGWLAYVADENMLLAYKSTGWDAVPIEARGDTSLSNVFVGYDAGGATTTGRNNTAAGVNALYANATGNNNTATGVNALYANTTGINNTAAGVNALLYKQDGTNNDSFSNCSGLGYNVRVSGDNQVQLGNSATTTYVYGAVQNRSDARDKTDIRDTVLGLDFICTLRPVDFRWDMRDDYFDTEDVEVTEVVDGVETTHTKTRLVPVPKDGSRKRNRYHHGVIAQEVEALIKATGIDFGGFQSHGVNGGADVLSIGYDEFIAPLIKAVQELAAENAALEARIAALEAK